MSPRSSISGELPIESYFNTSGGPAGTIGNKENTSLKRRITDTDDANQASTKKQRGEWTGQSSKGKNLEIQGKIRPRAEARPQPIPGSSGMTLIRTPISVAKPPRPISARAPADVEASSISSSFQQATPLKAGGTLIPATGTTSGSGLLTPQTVPHSGCRTGSRTGADAVDPAEPFGVSRFATRNGSVVSSIAIRPPVTPSRSKTKPDHVASAFRSTPHSQRIVPSSQWSDDEQPNPDSSRETNRYPFVVRPTEEPDVYPSETALPAPRDVPSRAFLASSLASAKFSAPALPTFIEPSKKCPNVNSGNVGNGDRKTGTLSLASSPRPKSLFSSSCWPRDGGRSSQIEPTSQFDEIEMNPYQSLLVCPILPLKTNTSIMATLTKRSQAGRPQDWSSHSEGQESSLEGCYHELSQPPSPLTPLPPSSPKEPDAIHGGTDNIGVNQSPLHFASRKSPDSPVPPSSPAFVADLAPGGITQPLPEMNIPAEDPTSDSDQNFLAPPSPAVRRQPLSATAETVENTTSRASDSSSASARTHIRISHAKLRSLPDSVIELDSDGEEMSSDSSIVVPQTSQGMSMSSSASSYLDLVGTLPSAIEDFLDMVNSDPSNT